MKLKSNKGANFKAVIIWNLQSTKAVKRKFATLIQETIDEYKIEYASPYDYSYELSGEFSVKIKCPGNVRISASIHDEKNKRVMENFFFQKEDNYYIVKALPPKRGKYKFYIYAQRKNEKVGKTIAIYYFDCLEASKYRYPILYNKHIKENDVYLFKPKKLRINTNGKVDFKLKSLAVNKVFIWFERKHVIEFANKGEGIFEINFDIPKGTDSLLILAKFKHDQKQYYILEYKLK